jgi:actin related protein 2/3 complex subunit 3
MAINSKWNGKESEILLGIGICPLTGNSKGPAKPLKDGEDIIDEAIRIYRFNVSMKTFPVKGAADRTMVYLTVYTNWFVSQLADIMDKTTALKFAELQAIKQELNASDKNHFLAGLLLPAKKPTEAKAWSDYLKQLRSELSRRLCERLYNENGSHTADFKFWLGLSRRPFMGLRYAPQK